MKEHIFKLIDKYIQNYELYETDVSYWLINPNTREWAIELTKDGHLWYEYYFFEKIYRLFSLDVVDNQHYITEWVEDTLQNGVRHTSLDFFNDWHDVEDVLQNGVILNNQTKNSNNNINILSNLWKKLKKHLKRLETSLKR